jgi:hypothetical protein
MPNDVNRLFAALAEDAGRARLPEAAAIRRHADRRALTRSLAGAAAVAVLVAGAAVGTRMVLADGSPVTPPAHTTSPLPSSPAPSSPPPSSSPPSSPPPSTSTSTTPTIPKSIPARVMLNADDANTARFERLARPHPFTEFCIGTDYPSTAEAGVRASVDLLYRQPGEGAEFTPSGEVFHTVTVYRRDGAQEFIDELRENVRLCPQSNRWKNRVVSWDGPGDESVLVERSRPATGDDGTPEGDGSKHYNYVIAVRIGDAVSVVENVGYEAVPAERAVAEDFAATAAERLERWRG